VAHGCGRPTVVLGECRIGRDTQYEAWGLPIASSQRSTNRDRVEGAIDDRAEGPILRRGLHAHPCERTSGRALAHVRAHGSSADPRRLVASVMVFGLTRRPRTVELRSGVAQPCSHACRARGHVACCPDSIDEAPSCCGSSSSRAPPPRTSAVEQAVDCSSIASRARLGQSIVGGRSLFDQSHGSRRVLRTCRWDVHSPTASTSGRPDRRVGVKGPLTRLDTFIAGGLARGEPRCHLGPSRSRAAEAGRATHFGRWIRTRHAVCHGDRDVGSREPAAGIVCDGLGRARAAKSLRPGRIALIVPAG